MSVQVAALAAEAGEAHIAPPARAALSAAHDRLRPCRIDDLPAIATLFQSVFYRAAGLPPQSLIAHLRDVYFDHPWHDPQMPSHVFVSANGTIDGFVGALPLRLRFKGEPVRASIAGALMVRDPASRPMAGARLLRSFMSGPQALSLGDTANWTSKTLWERIGGRTLPLASMEWLKIIRSAAFGVSVVRNRLPKPLAALLAPASGVAAAFGRRRASDPMQPWVGETVDDAAFLAAYNEVSAKLDIALDLDDAAGRWMLDQAARKTRHGQLFRRVVTARSGKLLGCYLVYARRGATAETLQITAMPGQGDAVFASLIDFATAEGCIAVRGRSQNALMNALFKSGCIMRHRGATVADTKNTGLMTALERGAAPLGGFFGETWTRLVSDEFA
ncbi:hypothetical protein sos41_39350 [Alphaproteobacteria bacterium SO-S41]|nr:hypothetical protein sos41_39350 [Alphaproteobacteria bacterium SO-S41]